MWPKPTPAKTGAVLFGKALSGRGSPSREHHPASAIAGAEITVTDPRINAVVAKTATAPDGGYRFDLPPGDYRANGLNRLATPKVKALEERALAIDPNLAEAHAAMGAR
jgi:hypothetical protein